MKPVRHFRLLGFLFLFGWGLAGCGQAQPASDIDRTRIAGEMQSVMDRMLEVWYPRVIDEENGGYISRFSHDWTQDPVDRQDKMIVTQARHVWSLSKLAERFPTDTLYLQYAAHGAKFLREVMWDATHGGFHQQISATGEVQSQTKTAYGNAFGIYGLAAYVHASGDEQALDLARTAFQWLETHSHDPQHLGYFQFLQPDGTAIPEGLGNTPPKDQNSSIHLLEAFTELYQVWPDPLVRERLEEMLHLVRDVITTEQGYLTLFLERDWTPVSYRDSSEAAREANHHLDHVSYGHDVETAFLMLEASHVLGRENDTLTHRIAKHMVDHALRFGWDGAVGGFYDGGYYHRGENVPEVVRDTKNWWTQAEALNTLLMMADLYPDDPNQYAEKFELQWTYVQNNLIDTEHGGWYDSGLDKAPDRKDAYKSHIWKGNYHTLRSLMNCLDRL